MLKQVFGRSQKKRAPQPKPVAEPQIEQPTFYSGSKQIQTLSDIKEMLDEGSTLHDISEHLVKFGNKNEKRVGQAIAIQLSKGQPIGDVMHHYYGDLAAQAITNGEVNSRLTNGIEQAIEILKITSAGLVDVLLSVTLPAMGMICSLGVILLMGSYAWPLVLGLVPQYKWPLVTSFMYEFWNLLDAHFIHGLATLLVIAIAAKPILNNWTGGLRQKIDNVFGFRQYRWALSAQLLFMMSSSLKAGRSIDESLDFAEKKSNKYLKWKITLIRNQLIQSKDDNFAYLLDVHLLESSLFNRMRMMAESKHDPVPLMEKSATGHSVKIQKFLNRTQNVGVMASMVLMLALSGLFLISIMLVAISGL